MLTLHNLTYIHPNRDLLFKNINLTVNKHNKTALIGNNGIGKSTLLSIIAGNLPPSSGSINTDSIPYYIPQIFGQFNDYTIAQALRIEGKLHALNEILEGNANDTNLAILDDDWSIEQRCEEVFEHWQLEDLDLTQKMVSLSGGQKTKVFLAGINIHQPELILMDEPSNHLDSISRNILYDFVQSTSSTLMVVSHDRKLLNMLNSVYELSKRGITVYGGNYDFYVEQKAIENNALHEGIRNKEKALRKAKEIERETVERKMKLDARGKQKKINEGMPKVMMKKLKNNAEKSTARIKDTHDEKIGTISQELSELRNEVPDIDKMKFGFGNSTLHKGKILIEAKDINFGYEEKMLWEQPLSITITSGERIVIKGSNGSGKTTLVKLFLGELEPKEGIIHNAISNAVYIDQDYSLIDNNLTVYEQSQRFNSTALEEYEIKIRLHRFLFTKDYWDKPCSTLSGGEKMRLMLCCLTISNKAPDLIIFDEPTNNLDIQNVTILTAAINDYQGTLIVISHDEYFLEQVNVKRIIYL